VKRWTPVLMFALTGCVSVDEMQVGPGVFDIATPASEFINTEGRARIILSERARELCATGYNRRSESLISNRQGRQTMIWRIACRSNDG
jgi:hypothetical protein